MTVPTWWAIGLGFVAITGLNIVGVVFIWRTLGRIKRDIDAYDETDRPSAGALAVYNMAMVLLVLGSAAVVGSVWLGVLVVVARLVWSTASGSGVLCTPGVRYWVIPALFLGMIHATALIDLGARILFAEAPRLMAASASKSGSKRGAHGMLRLVNGLVVFISLSVLPLFLIGLTWFIRIDADSITASRWYSLRVRTHLAESVAGIYRVRMHTAPNGREVQDRHMVVVFDDGSVYRVGLTNDSLEPRPESELRSFAERHTIPIIDSDWYPPRTTP